MGGTSAGTPLHFEKGCRIWGTTEAKAEKVLDHLCEKALLVDPPTGESAVLSAAALAGLLNLP